MHLNVWRAVLGALPVMAGSSSQQRWHLPAIGAQHRCRCHAVRPLAVRLWHADLTDELLFCWHQRLMLCDQKGRWSDPQVTSELALSAAPCA